MILDSGFRICSIALLYHFIVQSYPAMVIIVVSHNRSAAEAPELASTNLNQGTQPKNLNTLLRTQSSQITSPKFKSIGRPDTHRI